MISIQEYDIGGIGLSDYLFTIIVLNSIILVLLFHLLLRGGCGLA